MYMMPEDFVLYVQVNHMSETEFYENTVFCYVHLEKLMFHT